MKTRAKITALLITTMVLFFQCLSQGNITLTTQAEIDNFQTNYPGITVIEGNLTIGAWGGCDITNLYGLIVLESITGSLEIEYTSLLGNLLGLDSLKTIGSTLAIRSNSNLHSLSGLDALTQIGYDLIITNNEKLANLTGLGGLNNLGNKLKIIHNLQMTSIAGMESLALLHDVEIQLNESLVDLSGLDSVQVVLGEVSVMLNDALINFNGLNACTLIKGRLYVYQNGSLKNLSGLGSLETIGGGLNLQSNNDLDSLDGLTSLKYIVGNIEITGNNSLTRLSGLDSIAPDSINHLFITGNSNLYICDVHSICEFLETNNAATIVIHNNAPGCDSQFEVEAACEAVAIDEFNPQAYTFRIYPNPADGYVHITFQGSQRSSNFCTVTNMKGEICYFSEFLPLKNHLLVNTRDWSPGIYICIISDGKQIYNRKLVIL